VVKPSGILGVDHIGVFTARIRQGEALYAALFGAVVLFRGVTFRGSWVAVDARYDWEDIARKGLEVSNSFLRAGGLTLILSDEPAAARPGPVNHVGIGCTDGEHRRIREMVRERRYRVLEEGADGFKFIDELGLIWDVDRGMEAANPPEKMLDLESGRMV
jgi:hypothetical protein